MKKNTGIKIILVILIIVCMAQGSEISTLNEKIDNFSSKLNNMDREFNEQKILIEELIEQKESSMNVSYKILKPDWETGTMKVEFSVNPINVFDNTKVFVNNEKANTELTKNEDNYIGTVEYPIDSNMYQTTVHIYDGNFERESKIIDISGAVDWKNEFGKCEFEGYSWYGNGLLTMAGAIDYSLNIDEKVLSSKLVFCDKVEELEPGLNGRIDINESQYVGVSETEETLLIEKIYIEINTDAGNVYKVYPYVFEGAEYNIIDSFDEESEYEVDLKGDMSYYVEQHDMMKVSTEDGKEYKIGIFKEYDE